MKLFGTEIYHSKDVSCSGTIKADNQCLDVDSSGVAEHSKETRTSSTTKEDHVEVDSTDQEQDFKKPEKVLPCPRCNSCETKFCYFNNYNVKQPRHFCKNCQRYWTAGGTIRNVPIGAGRRKNKHLASQYHQIMSSVESLTASGACSGNGMVLKFDNGVPLYKSMESMSMVSRGDEKSGADCVENTNDPSSCGSCVTASPNELPEIENIIQTEQTHLPGFAAPFIYPWNPSFPCVDQNQFQWFPTAPTLALPGCVPLQFVPTSNWACLPSWSNGCHSPSSTMTSCSENASPILGKHCRDWISVNEEHANSFVLPSKTPRVDKPNHSSPSHLWSSRVLRPKIIHPIPECKSLPSDKA